MIVEKSRNVHIYQLPLKQKSVKALLISDVHWDNPKCDRDLLRRHLEEAKALNAPVFINGDLFCVMQGKYDPRRSKSNVRPEHNKSNYLDLIVEDAAEWFKPYADIIHVVGYGNHETAILRNCETDLIQRFVERLNAIKDPDHSRVYTGGYGGWIVFKAKLHETGGRISFKVKYHHGFGGGGAVTKGAIQHNRMMTAISGADAIWMGHVHEDYEMSYVAESLDQNWNVSHKEVLMIRTPSYKEEYADGFGEFHVEKGRPVKPIGGRWLEIDAVVPKGKLGGYELKGYTYKTKNI